MKQNKLDKDKVLHISSTLMYFSELHAFFGVSREQMKKFIYREKISKEIKENLRKNKDKAKLATLERVARYRRERYILKENQKRELYFSTLAEMVSNNRKKRDDQFQSLKLWVDLFY